MKFCLIVVLVHVVCIAVIDGISENVEINSQKISGQFPFQVSIRRKFSTDLQICNGAILDRRFILTTAHCVRGVKPETIYALLGRINEKSHRINIEIIKQHESYNSVSNENDIALLRTVQDIDYSVHEVQPIQLPPSHWSDSLNGGMLQVPAWIDVNMNQIILNNKFNEL